jgi:hypothetical protein
MKLKRPFLLWLICLIFLAIALVELIQTIRVFSSWELLLAVRYQPGPLVNLMTSLFFFVFFLVSAVLLWLRLSWAPECTGTALVTASVYHWLDRLALAANPASLSSQVFNLIAFFIVLLLLLVSLWVLKPSMNPSSAEMSSREEVKSWRNG